MKDISDLNYRLIHTQSGLQRSAGSIQNEAALAVDLEADSMFHFKEKVCLIQMATDKENVVLDPLKVTDLSPLKPVFSNRGIQKVFHGADYDVRSLYRDFGIEINNLFDTELASRFLGVKETSLEAVLQKRFNVNLDKKYQKKDWSQRPLPREMIEYAATDVQYLVPLAGMLQAELKKKGRLAWVHEECEYLSRVRPVSMDGQPLYLSFKGAGRLDRRSLALLESLLQFRKQMAARKDKPLFKVLGNHSLMKIVTARPDSLKGLEKAHALSPKQLDMYGRALISRIEGVHKIAEENLPIYPRKRLPRPAPEVSKRVKALKSWREGRAGALDIDPGLLCNNVLICTLAVRNPIDAEGVAKIKDMKNWQKNEFGDEIAAVLRKVR